MDQRLDKFKFRRIPFVAALLLMLLGATGCDSVCKFKSNDVANVHNLTGRDLSLTGCKVLGGKFVVQVPHDHDGDLSIGQSDASTVRGGMNAQACKDVHDGEVRRVGFNLSQESFYDVKLCRDPVTFEYFIVESMDICPQHTEEQNAPASCG